MKYSIKHVSYFLWTIVNLSNYFNVCNLWKLGIFLISKYDLKVRHDWVTEEQQHQKIWFNLMWPLIYNKNSKIIISLISIFWHFLLKIYAYIYIYIYIYIYQSLCVDHNKLWKILKEMGIPDLLTSLLRNLFAGQ